MLKKLKNLVVSTIVRILKYKELQKNSFFVNFIHEGNVKILLPKLSIGELMVINIAKKFLLYGQTTCGGLTKIIFELYKKIY